MENNTFKALRASISVNCQPCFIWQQLSNLTVRHNSSLLASTSFTIAFYLGKVSGTIVTNTVQPWKGNTSASQSFCLLRDFKGSRHRLIDIFPPLFLTLEISFQSLEPTGTKHTNHRRFHNTSLTGCYPQCYVSPESLFEAENWCQESQVAKNNLHISPLSNSSEQKGRSIRANRCVHPYNNHSTLSSIGFFGQNWRVEPEVGLWWGRQTHCTCLL